ncbi:MAG: GGDEF domain-containing protein, partial [Chloroflexota bacterium]|nr:GGDEF domain-containing protein [Chloroflexota bacterium]
GEEFVVMLPGSSSANAAEVAERIRALTEATVIELSPGHRDQITVSIGVAAWPADATDRVRLLEVADAALYRAKNAGRNRVVVAGQAFEARADEGVQGPAASDADDLTGARDRVASAPAGPVALHLAG